MVYNDDYSRVTRLLKRIAYKPHWNIATYVPRETGHFFIQWVFESDGQMHKGRKWYVSPHSTDSEIIQTALMAAIAAEEHETREHFLFDGEAVFGPHHDIEALKGIKQSLRAPHVEV